ncbi:hypothetical protein [Phaeovulum sp. W22_SRMD_FR3]|uniref:hypothetical protein n=1 Tax=Phaeovulum sp. W22_SRMD_FR3 TaxID=3240274 RepID=UPI003F9C8A38
MSLAVESAALGPCGWPYVCVSEHQQVTILGLDPLRDIPGDAPHCGDVALAGIERPVPVFLVSAGSQMIRIAVIEISNGVYVVACNDAAIERLENTPGMENRL